VGGDLLVDSVGLDVFGEVLRRRGIRTESGGAGGVAPVGECGGHLERGEVTDQCAGPPPVHREQGHHVRVRQGDGRYVGNVVPVGVVEIEPSHRGPEQLGVHALRAAAAVLVGLDLDQCCLRRTVQPRDAEAVRIGLLQLVHRPIPDERAEVLQRRASMQMGSQRRSVVGIHQIPQDLRDLGRRIHR
jgi:hypothetical protein